jgi:enoyl-CoA hydratase/carnithine racemase
MATSAPFTAITVTADGPIGHIWLDRPAKLNALSRAVLEELAEAAAWFDARSEVKVVVVAGNGRAFSAGFDLQDPAWADLGPPERSTLVGRAMADAVASMAAVTIAAVHGHCIGGGVVLAAACDLRIAATSARFRIPEVDLGIPLFWGGVPRLQRELGPALTKELVMTGRTFDGEEAKAMRFVNRLVPDDELGAAVDAFAAEVAARPGIVLRATKAQVDHGDGGIDSDLAGYRAAAADPEARASARRYVEGLGHR